MTESMLAKLQREFSEMERNRQAGRDLAWAHRILARHAAGEAIAPFTLKCARQAARVAHEIDAGASAAAGHPAA